MGNAFVELVRNAGLLLFLYFSFFTSRPSLRDAARTRLSLRFRKGYAVHFLSNLAHLYATLSYKIGIRNRGGGDKKN